MDLSKQHLLANSLPIPTDDFYNEDASRNMTIAPLADSKVCCKSYRNLLVLACFIPFILT